MKTVACQESYNMRHSPLKRTYIRSLCDIFGQSMWYIRTANYVVIIKLTTQSVVFGICLFLKFLPKQISSGRHHRIHKLLEDLINCCRFYTSWPSWVHGQTLISMFPVQKSTCSYQPLNRLLKNRLLDCLLTSACALSVGRVDSWVCFPQLVVPTPEFQFGKCPIAITFVLHSTFFIQSSKSAKPYTFPFFLRCL